MPFAFFVCSNEGIAKRQNRKKPINPFGFKPVIEMYDIYILFVFISIFLFGGFYLLYHGTFNYFFYYIISKKSPTFP